MELSRTVDEGELCRKAVELCISRLGIDRIGIWLMDPADPEWKIGSWGTDEEGRPRDERGIRLPRSSVNRRDEIYDGSIPWVVKVGEVTFDDRSNPVGRCDVAIAPLWDGSRVIGEIVADNLLTGRPLTDEDGEILAIFARTVAHLCVLKRSEAALKDALKAKAILLGELQHRTRNSFGIMRSLISIEAGRSRDPAQADTLIKLRDRVSVLTSLYAQLDSFSGPPEVMLGEYLQGIAAGLLAGYGAETRDVALECRMETVVVDMKRAVPLGLIVNELITDSLKHAFPEGRRGRITLDLGRVAGIAGVACDEGIVGDGKGVLLCVSDDGIGLPPGFDLRSTKGFGITLIDLLCAQIDARLEIGVGASGSGTAFSVFFAAQD